MPKIKKAFTLIELLVVIAIIAILAAILFPVFAQAREKARAISCLSNEKEICLAILMYVQDYDERMPTWSYWVNNNPDADTGNALYGQTDPNGGGYKYHYNGWDNLVGPYVKNRGIFHCPDEFGPGPDYNNTGADNSGITGTLNYAINGRLSGHSWNGWHQTAKLSAIQWPATAILISEDCAYSSTAGVRADNNNDGSGEWGWTGDQKQALVIQAYTNAQPGPLAMHNGGSNYGFTDGHAKWFSGTAMGLLPNTMLYPVPTAGVQEREVDKILDHSGNHVTFHVSTGN